MRQRINPSHNALLGVINLSWTKLPFCRSQPTSANKRVLVFTMLLYCYQIRANLKLIGYLVTFSDNQNEENFNVLGLDIMS